ncbi:MAG: aconitate hydratase AcnA [Thermoplasmata archaeon]|nr:aconitate hydratase AcnA [Thermoplasmata archaeon]MCI4359348.1 aconitate hydratase AcnA [Thermoplasmata archaeon]
MIPDSTIDVTDTLQVGEERSVIWRVDRIPGVDAATLKRRPKTIRILLENLLRNLDRGHASIDSVRALALGESVEDLPFFPSRALLQDFTGVPVVVDLSAMRDAAEAHHVDPTRVNAVIPVDLVIDHSVQVDSFGQKRSVLINLDREFERNGERYDFLRWAQKGFRQFRVVPPGNGIVHQVNLEYLAQVVDRRERNGRPEAFPDTLVGTDSHTPMVNGLGVLGWGVGGIEAEAAMLGEPYFLSRIELVGVRLTGRLPEGATATDLVLTVTRALREKGVVDKFVEFFGPGLETLSVPDRATISNMSPEYGATASLFPIDHATLGYLNGTGRPPAVVARVEAYAKAQGLWHDPSDPEPEFSEVLPIDLTSIVPTVSGPGNPEESMSISALPASFRTTVGSYRKDHPRRPAPPGGLDLPDGAVVIAAITSCTNTSNPSVMVGAGLIAKRAQALGLKVPPYVKTSLAPGSKVVTEYLERAGLMQPLSDLGFALVGYGCTTCIGNSGPLPPTVARAVEASDGYVAAVLSGNRNFEARIHNQVRANYLASPMLVVAYALAGRVDVDLAHEPLGSDAAGRPVFLRDLWPGAEEVRRIVESSLDPSIFRDKYQRITEGDPHWNHLASAGNGGQYRWNPDSTYLRLPPYFSMDPPKPPTADGTLVDGARVLALLGDRVSTDHISPAGEIPPDSPAGRYLVERGVPPAEFNTYGTRRGNHEVMARGTLANVRLKNRLALGKEGGFTRHQPTGDPMTIFDAAQRYRAEGVPLLLVAGASYGQGSSRDWAAKGPLLLGVRAVLAKSFERIHRGNLVGMGVMPLSFHPGEGETELGLTGRERYTLSIGRGKELVPNGEVDVRAEGPEGQERRFSVKCRIDSAVELAYYRAGGILPYALERIGRDGNGSRAPSQGR